MRLRTCREASEAVADICAISPKVIRRGCVDGLYPCLQVGNRMLVDVDALREILTDEGNRANLIGTAELSMRIGLSESTIRRAVNDGWMPSVRVGRHMKFDLAKVQQAIIDKMHK